MGASASTAPKPPSVVAEPPIPISTCFAPARVAAATSWPRPAAAGPHGVIAGRPPDRGQPYGQRRLDDGHRAGRVVRVVPEDPRHFELLAERSADPGRVPAPELGEDVEKTLAPVRHRGDVTVPARCGAAAAASAIARRGLSGADSVPRYLSGAASRGVAPRLMTGPVLPGPDRWRDIDVVGPSSLGSSDTISPAQTRSKPTFSSARHDRRLACWTAATTSCHARRRLATSPQQDRRSSGGPRPWPMAASSPIK